MNKIELLYGIIIGLLVTLLGMFLFILLFTDYTFIYGIQIMQANNSVGKLLSLAAVLNLAIFFLMLKLQKELIARGLVLAMILLAIITIFV